MINFDKFKVSLRDFSFKAIDVIKSIIKHPHDYPTTWHWIWNDNGGGLIGGYQDFKDHEHATWICEKQIEELNEYKILISQINTESKLKNIMNGFEFLPNSSAHIEEKYIIQRFISEFLNRIEKTESIANCYDGLFSEFQAALIRNKIEMRIIAHLHGFLSDIDLYEFDNKIVLKKFSIEELNDLYGEESFYKDSDYYRYRHFLIKNFKVERKITSTQNTEIKLISPVQEILADMNMIVNIMRLFLPGYLKIDRVSELTVNFEVNIHGGGSVWSTEKFIESNFVLNKSDLDRFVIFYKSYNETKLFEKKKFNNSFRWLSNISIKQNIEDKFLDYMIVLEALYLEDRHELSYRLPLRIAYFLGDDYRDRNRYFRILKKAYSLRSAMVHEGKAISDTIVIEAQDFSVSFRKKDFINKIEEIVYLTISKIVIPGSKNFPIGADNWDNLILAD